MAYQKQGNTSQQPSRSRPVLQRDDVSKLLRQSFPKFNRISDNDRKTGLAVLQASREASFALQRITGDAYLMQCVPQSIRDAYENCAMIGLSLNPALQYAALIPRFNKKLGIYEAQLWPMYRGFIKLATDTGLVTSIEVENVYSADQFELSRSSDRTELKHTLAHGIPRNTKENRYMGTYVIARLTKDRKRPLVEWVPAEDVDKAKLSSDNYDPNNPKCVWVKWEDEMRRKVAIKRAQKFWPKTNGRLQERLAAAIHMDNEASASDRPNEPNEPIDVTPKKLITKDQAAELTKMAMDMKLNIDKVCQVYFIDAIVDLPANLFDEVKQRIEAAAQAAAQRNKGNKDDKNEGPAK